MSDEPDTYEGDDALRVIEAMNQQAREVLVFPPFICNMLVGTNISIVLEFQRIPGVAIDSTIVQLNFEQARMIQDFLNEELMDLTELELLDTMREPTKENEDDLEA